MCSSGKSSYDHLKCAHVQVKLLTPARTNKVLHDAISVHSNLLEKLKDNSLDKNNARSVRLDMKSLEEEIQRPRSPKFSSAQMLALEARIQRLKNLSPVKVGSSLGKMDKFCKENEAETGGEERRRRPNGGATDVEGDETGQEEEEVDSKEETEVSSESCDDEEDMSCDKEKVNVSGLGSVLSKPGPNQVSSPIDCAVRGVEDMVRMAKQTGEYEAEVNHERKVFEEMAQTKISALGIGSDAAHPVVEAPPYTKSWATLFNPSSSGTKLEAFGQYVQNCSQRKELENQGAEIPEQYFENGLCSSNSSEWVRVSKRREVRENKRVEEYMGEGMKASSGGEMPQPLVGSLGKEYVREENKTNRWQSVRRNKVSMGRKK
ncbi:hypothetical protein U1Q18_039949 [Sarracenia purpurea var. burkii]